MLDTSLYGVLDLDANELAAVDGGGIPIVVALGLVGAAIAFGYMVGKDSVAK